jgi:cytochrome P450
MAKRATTPTESRSLPGPSGLEWLRVIRNVLGNDMSDQLQYLRGEYGQIVAFVDPAAPRTPMVMLAKPEAVQHVLETNQGNYVKSDVYRDELTRVFGEGLLTSSGDLWMRQNRLIAPLFTKSSVYTFTEIVREETATMLDQWSHHQGPIDLLSELERLTLLIIGKAMFSTDMDEHAEEISEILEVLRNAFQRRTSGLVTVPDWAPTPTVRRELAAVDRLDEIVYGLIEKRRGNADAYDDLLSKLILAQDDETGNEMSDEQIRDELVTFLLAGHETTATALTWTWYLLAQHPETHRNLHEQVTDAQALDRAEFSPEIRTELQYVSQCVQEGMRIYPPVPVIAREVDTTDTACGYELPAGTQVVVPQIVVHRDPELWDDPLEYRPGRFAPDAGDDRPTYSYFPFGGGARMCTGRQFALMEAQLILASVLREFRLELHSPDPDAEIGLDSAVTMVPDRPIQMTLRQWD